MYCRSNDLYLYSNADEEANSQEIQPAECVVEGKAFCFLFLEK